MKKASRHFFVWLYFFAPSIVAAAEAPGHIPPESDPVITNLAERYDFSSVIIVPPEKPFSPGDVRHIVLDPATETVAIIPGDLGFGKEASSFAQFRVHYAFYWSLFMTMLILDAAWVE